MSTLDLSLLQPSRHILVEVALPGGGHPSPQAFRFRAHERIGNGNSEVYRGSLHREGSVESLDVLCKVARGDVSPLEHEATLYATNLKTLQGESVPKFHGLFRGIYMHSGPIACIFLGSFGTRPEGGSRAYTRECKCVAKPLRIFLKG